MKTEDENDIADIPTESKIDIGELKKEISDIIDKQCVVSIYILFLLFFIYYPDYFYLGNW